MRISKLLSQRGLCSRREADRFIEAGWVYVNGQPATLGQKVLEGDHIELRRQAQEELAGQVTILLHKPVGLVSNLPENGYKEARVLLTPEHQYRQPKERTLDPRPLQGLAVAGRLDIDSTGLLVFTQNGQLARKLIGENSGVEKEYLVRVEGTLDENDLKLLNHGLSLDGKELKPAHVEWLNQDQLRFVLKEGRKRQIRRMCEAVGLKVLGLKRVRIGQIMLGDLPLGKWRLMSERESF